MRASLILLALCLLLLPATAQYPCFGGDDGFQGTCCNVAQPTLPGFPAVTEAGVYACLEDCQNLSGRRVTVSVSAPSFFLCDHAIITLTVSPATPAGPTITGRFIAKYSRTWISSFGGGTQVWRFLLNGDWTYQPSISADVGCPIPPHANPVHAIGSIDYGCVPEFADSWRIALNLSHLPGCISHGVDSARPLPANQSHNDHSYHLVAPRPFAFLGANDIQGTSPRDATRSSVLGSCFPLTYTCLNEVRLRSASLVSRHKNCLCVDEIVGGPWVHQTLSGHAHCEATGITGQFSSTTGPNPHILHGLAGLRLGRWTNASIFPGVMDLTVYVGYITSTDACEPAAALAPDRVYGVGTLGTPGWFIPLVTDPAIAQWKAFVDLANSLVPSNTANPIPVPGSPGQPSPVPCLSLIRAFGAPAYSSRLWQLNPQ